MTATRKIGFVFTLCVLLLLFLETCCRLVLMFTSGVGFFKPAEIIYQYYPQIPTIKNAEISESDSTLDVLILSCSVLHRDWGNLAEEMERCYKPALAYNRLKVWNASGIGHSSYDNLIKAQLLAGKKFDRVIYYDAINDARLNNCPDSIFKSDYSHYIWYEDINTVRKHREMNITVLPYLAERLYITAKRLCNSGSYIPSHYSLRPDWLNHGNSFRSISTYRHHLIEIAEHYKLQHCPMVVISFVHYLPAGYTLQQFKRRELDYTFCAQSRETEIWGRHQNVVAFIDSANAVCRSLSTEKNLFAFADIRTDTLQTGNHFADVCHFSPSGLREFAGILCARFL